MSVELGEVTEELGSRAINTTIKTTLGEFSGNYLYANAVTKYGNAKVNGTVTPTYVYSGVHFHDTYNSHEFSIPVQYNVGSSGSNWYGESVNTEITLDYSNASLSFSIVSGKLSTVFTVYSSSENWSPTISNVGCSKKTGISIKTTSNYRSDTESQPTIVGKRNSPLNDSGSDTKLDSGIVQWYYKTEGWECDGNTCDWGKTISATYFANASKIVLYGTLSRISNNYKILKYLDELPIPTAPSSTETDTVTFKDVTSTVPRTETQTVTRSKKYRFKNWNTKANGTGTIYGTGGQSLSTTAFIKDTVLYAQWEDVTEATTYTVPSDWTTDTLALVSSSPVTTATVSCYDRSTVFDSHKAQQYARKPMKLKQWKGNDGSVILPGGKLGGASVYTAEFVIDNSKPSQYYWVDNKFVPKKPSDRAGWTYLGLSKSQSSSTVSYSLGEEITVTADLSLYAVWKANGAGKLFDGEEYKTYQIYIYDDVGGWKLYMPKIFNGTDWNTIYV